MKKDKLSLYIIFNILFIFVFSFIREVFKTPYSDLSKMMVFFSIVNVIISIIVLENKIKEKKYKLRLYDLLILIIIILLIISTIFAKNINVSLFGIGGRYEGLFSLIYYLSLLFISSFIDKDKKKNIVNLIIVTGIIQTIYGLTHMNINISKYNPTWVNGLTTNPNFFGTYILMCLSCAMGIYSLDNEEKYNYLYGFIILVLLVGLLISNTTSCLLGFIIVFIYLIIYLILKKKYEKIVSLLIIVIFTSSCVYLFDGTTLFKDLIKTKNEAVELYKGNNNNNDYGTHRITIWKKTMKVVPKYIIHGVGIDNFIYAQDEGPIVIRKYTYDKAHNEYLQILICEGIFALICYLLLYTTIVLKSIKSTYKNDNIYLLLPVIGYLIQAFFNISVIEVAPVFFILLGLCIDRDKNINIKKKTKRIKKH